MAAEPARRVPVHLAKALGLRVVPAIDERQELAGLESRPRIDPFAMMRGAWQRHRHVAYVISGSARMMLTELVTSERSPFFQHLSLMELGPLAREDAVALLVGSAPPDQLLGETLTGIAPPIDEIATASYLERLRDVLTRDDEDRWRIADPAKVRITGRTGALSAGATIDNLLLWLDRPMKRGRARAAKPVRATTRRPRR